MPLSTESDAFVEVTYLPVSLRCPSLSRLHLTSADGGAVCDPRAQEGQRHDADGDGALSPKELDAFNISCGGGALEADDLAFLLDSFEVDAPSGGLTGRGFRQYFAHALGEDFDEARDDLRKALGREA